jgi:hypothetical protein
MERSASGRGVCVCVCVCVRVRVCGRVGFRACVVRACVRVCVWEEGKRGGGGGGFGLHAGQGASIAVAQPALPPRLRPPRPCDYVVALAIRFAFQARPGRRVLT